MSLLKGVEELLLKRKLKKLSGIEVDEEDIKFIKDFQDEAEKFDKAANIAQDMLIEFLKKVDEIDDDKPTFKNEMDVLVTDWLRNKIGARYWGQAQTFDGYVRSTKKLDGLGLPDVITKTIKYMAVALAMKELDRLNKEDDAKPKGDG